MMNQISSKFKIHLVCHEVPCIINKYDKLDVIQVDIKIPSSKEEMMIDKYLKVKYGLVNVKKYVESSTGRSSIMIVDADDRVDYRVAQWVDQKQNENGWFLKDGYIYPYGEKFLFNSCLLENSFYKVCGTSAIIYVESGDLPNNVSDSSSAHKILKDGHHRIVDNMQKRGSPLEPLPFPGACYVTDTDDNHSGVSWLKWKGKKKLFRKAISVRPLLSNYKKRFAFE
jgi:hypothetical protein